MSFSPLWKGKRKVPSDSEILVVDDDPAILMTVADILEFEGYSVCTASNGAEALALLDDVRPRLILLDMRMPVLDGWGFSMILKERGFQSPVVVMTAAQDAGRWAKEIEAAAYLAKPFDLNDLLSTVESFHIGKD